MKSIAAAALLLFVLMVVSFLCGPATPLDAWRDILSSDQKILSFVVSEWGVFELRTVHIFLSVSVGIALATAGRTMQHLLQNPLADPHVTGLSAGSTCAVLFTLLFAPSFAQKLVGGWIPSVWLSAFLGSLATLILLKSILFNVVRSWGAPALALVGLFLNASFSALLMVIFARLSPANLSEVQNWTLGAIQPYGLGQASFLVPILLAPSFYLLKRERSLMLVAFGQDFALTNGVSFVALRAQILICLMLISSAAVCAAGSVGFVGLLVPHLTRRWMSQSQAIWHRPLLNALLGACVLLAADLCSRTLTPPMELPVGVYCAVFSIPFLFAVLLMRRAAK